MQFAAKIHEMTRLALWAGASAIVLCGCSGGASVELPPAGSPVAAEPAGPPPPHAPKLATHAEQPAAAAPTSQIDTQLGRAASLIVELEPALAKVSLDSAAPAALIVQAGGRQADVVKSDVPTHERWEIRFPPGNSIESYTRQLDHFKIELGAIGVEDYITYLTNLSNPKPKTRPGFASDETRLYLVWQRGEMAEADQQLAARAGVRTANKLLAHFVPAEVETELARLEEAYAKQLGIQKIQKTVFGIRVAGQDGFRFYVIEQKPDLR
jgi:hypothetical protein